MRRASQREAVAACAVHESAHGVIAEHVGHCVLSAELSADSPDLDAAGFIEGSTDYTHLCIAPADRIAVLLAGYSAQEHWARCRGFLWFWPAQSSDLASARALLPAAGETLHEHMSRARSLVRQHWPAIERVAIALLRRQTLSRGEFLAALTGPEPTVGLGAFCDEGLACFDFEDSLTVRYREVG